MVNNHKPYGVYEKIIKRPMDFLCALLAIIVLSPIMLVVALLVRTKLGSPILFKQERPGRDEKVFMLYKFRTMTDERDCEGNLLSDDIRLTRFGKILRSTSLDELPELINILKGEMAIVGPRPLLVEYLPYYLENEHHRHDVRPGLTGFAQINGRNAINSWEERFEYDLEYVNHVTFLMDLKIVLKTIRKVIHRSDIQVGSEIKVGRVDLTRCEDKHTQI